MTVAAVEEFLRRGAWERHGRVWSHPLLQVSGSRRIYTRAEAVRLEVARLRADVARGPGGVAHKRGRAR